MTTKDYDEMLKKMSYDFYGRDALSFRPEEIMGIEDVEGDDVPFSDLSPSQKLRRNRDYFFKLLYALYHSEYQEGFYIYGANDIYDKVRKDLGVGMQNLFDVLKGAGYIDFIKKNLTYTKSTVDQMFTDAMTKYSFRYSIDKVLSNHVEIEIENDKDKYIGVENVNDKLFKVYGKPQGASQFTYLKDFWPEGIITQDGTFYMTPRCGQHEIVCKFLSLMGENMYNAVRVYNTSRFVSVETGEVVNTGGTNVGILFSSLQDYIPSVNYTDFEISEAQAKTMLGLYHIANRIYEKDNTSRRIKYTYQDCIENSIGLFSHHMKYDTFDMSTKAQNLKRIEWESGDHFDRTEFLKHEKVNNRLKF